jgi:CcmD family protein
MENLGYLMAAYTVIWAVVFGYLLYLRAKQGRLRRQIERLEKSLEESGPDV